MHTRESGSKLASLYRNQRWMNCCRSADRITPTFQHLREKRLEQRLQQRGKRNIIGAYRSNLAKVPRFGRPAEKAAEKARNPSTYLQRYMNKSNEQETPTRTKKTTTVTAAIAVPRATTSAFSVPISSVTTLRGVVSKSGSAIRVPAKAKAKF